MASFTSSSQALSSAPAIASSSSITPPIESYEERSAVSLNTRPTMFQRLIKNFGLAGVAQEPASDNSTSNTDQRFLVIADGAEEEFSDIQVRPLSYAEMAARGTDGVAKAAAVGSIEVPLSAVYGEQEHYEVEDYEDDFSTDDNSDQRQPLEKSLSDLSSAEIDNNALVAPPVKAEYLHGYRADTLEKKFLRGMGNGHKKCKKQASHIIRLVQKPL